MTRVRRFYGHQGQAPTGLVPVAPADDSETVVDTNGSESVPGEEQAKAVLPGTAEEQGQFTALVEEGLDHQEAFELVWPDVEYIGPDEHEDPEQGDAQPSEDGVEYVGPAGTETATTEPVQEEDTPEESEPDEAPETVTKPKRARAKAKAVTDDTETKES